MKFLKYLLFAILGIGVIYLIMCAMGPKSMNVTQSIVINAPAESVFEEIADLEKMNVWSPWVKMDTAMTHSYAGEAGKVGQMHSWKSEVMGDGSQAITELRGNEYMKTELKFVDWGDDVSNAEFTLAPEGEGTKTTWGMTSPDLPFMARGMMLVMGNMDETFQQGLADLKKLVEAKPKAEKVAYEVVDITDTYYVGQNHTGLSMDAVDSSLFGNAYMTVGKAIGGMDKAAGMPFCIGRNVNYETKMMDLEMCLPTATEMKAADGLTSGKIPAGRCAKFVYTGPYEGTAGAWDTFFTQVEKDGLKPRWDGYEVYANDPEVVKDPAKFITWLMVPIE